MPRSILDGLDAGETWDAVIGAEPSLGRLSVADEFDAALLAIADFVDLKSPYMLGHARGVSELAGAAGATVGLNDGEVALLRRAGVVQGLGRLGVSNAIWDKKGTLGAGEWERVRMHPYLTERMLSQSEALAPLGALAVQHCASGSTVRAILAASRARRSRCRLGCSARPTPTRRCASRVRIAMPSVPSRQQRNCGAR